MLKEYDEVNYNGKNFIFPNASYFKKITKEKALLGSTIGQFDLFKKDFKLVEKDNDLIIGFYFFLRQKCWMHNVFLRLKSELYIVHLEKLTCEVCGWNGSSANPLIADLYFGMNDEFELRLKASILPQSRCPGCNNGFSRHSIWLGEL